MKLKSIFLALTALTLAVACQKDNKTPVFKDIVLDKSYLSIPEEGGSTVVVIKAASDWQMNKIYSVKTGEKDDDDKDIYEDRALPEWLNASQTSGSAGETRLEFTADPTSGGREAEVQLQIGPKTQFLLVRQGSMAAVTATCKEVVDGPEGKTYRVKGVCKNIYNTTYGNWHLDDGTADITIYGTLDANGKTKNFLSLGLNEGDIVTVEGPKQLYGTTVELVDVTVVEIEKSLIKITSSAPATVDANGGSFTVDVSYKGKIMWASLPEDCNWIVNTGTQYTHVEPDIYDRDPMDKAVVSFVVNANPTKQAREAVISFWASDGETSSSASITVKQKAGSGTTPGGDTPGGDTPGGDTPGGDTPGGDTPPVPENVLTPAQAYALVLTMPADVNSTESYYIKGKICRDITANNQFGTQFGNCTFYISEDGTDADNASGSVFQVFRTLYLGNRKWETGDKTLAKGDEVVVYGPVVNYKGNTPETVANASYLISINGATE